MRKKINKDLVFYFNNLYPYSSNKKSAKRNFVTIGIGGNIGNVIKNFNKLFLCLNGDHRFKIVKTAPILKNPPFGYLEQDDFYNSLIVLQTNLSAFECLKEFQRYEKRFKRKRSFRDAPRTLDIDIIFFNEQRINTKYLVIPHIGYKNRESVQLPLKFLTR